MLVSLTVGKVDAGVAVLLTEDKRLIEFPSILLPSDITSGSIVDIEVARNLTKESSTAASFAAIQSQIFHTFGQRSPTPPILRCRNATQTSVVLEWDPVDIATAELRTLSLYRNGSKAGTIPRPTETLSTKISGLAVDTEYAFYLVLRTSAGTYKSEELTVRTHKMTDLSGITITPGIMPAPLKESLYKTAEAIGAKIVDQVRIDTTHFVCTEGRGPLWERAVETNVPVVVPDWIKGCEREGRIVGVRGYYLNADPRMRQVGPGAQVQAQAAQQQVQQQPQQQTPTQTPQSPQTGPTTQITPPTPDRPTTTTGASANTQQSTTSSAADNEEDDDSQSDSAPPPPPKPISPSHSPSAAEPKSATEEPKALVSDLKPTQGDAEDDSEEESEAEGADYKALEAGEAGIPERLKGEGAEGGAKGTETPEIEKFDDVAL